MTHSGDSILNYQTHRGSSGRDPTKTNMALFGPCPYGRISQGGRLGSSSSPRKPCFLFSRVMLIRDMICSRTVSAIWTGWKKCWWFSAFSFRRGTIKIPSSPRLGFWFANIYIRMCPSSSLQSSSRQIESYHPVISLLCMCVYMSFRYETRQKIAMSYLINSSLNISSCQCE